MERSVSVATIRTQVKTVAAKLGCTRQSQIGRIVRSIPYAAL
jgi:DNA-binding CsgD family transcriptional regulator